MVVFQMETPDDNKGTNTTTLQYGNPTEKGVFEIPLEFFLQYSFIGNVIVTPIICIMGICGNSLGVYVLKRECRHQELGVYRYMLALMVFDNIYLLLGLAISTTSIIEVFDWYLANMLITHFTYVAGYLDLVIYHTSSVLLTVMALERLNALVRPFTVRRSWLSKYPLRLIAAIFVFSVVYILPYPFCFETTTVKSSQDNLTMHVLQVKPEVAEFYVKYSFVETIVSCLYPIVMLVINIAIPIAYRRVVQQRKMDLPNVSTKDTQQLKVTLMIVWIAVMYILLAIPKIFMQSLIFIDGDYNFDGKYSLTFYFLVFTGDIFARLNAANDFFIYVLVSERHRKMLKFMLCKCCISSDNFFSDIYRSASQVFSRGNNVTSVPKFEQASGRSTQISVIEELELSYTTDKPNCD